MSGHHAVILAHILPSMVPVVRRAIQLDIAVTFIGKPYSTIMPAAEAMREAGAMVFCPTFGRLGYLIEEMQEFVRRIHIDPAAELFDSGGVLRSIFGRGNQLTAYGASPGDIGLNPIKRQAEAPHIARAILSQIDHLGRRVMIIGDGVIGSALKRAIGGRHVTERPDIIIGAMGADISAQIRPFIRDRDVELHSAASWDIAFNALLREGYPVANRGCPVNFTRTVELESERGMLETRKALLEAIAKIKVGDVDACRQDA